MGKVLEILYFTTEINQVESEGRRERGREEGRREGEGEEEKIRKILESASSRQKRF